MTFNIRNDRGLDGRNIWWFRRRATVEAIREVAPDIAGLQEVRRLQLLYLRSQLPEYGFLSQGRAFRGRGGEHCPVLYRRDRFEVDHWEVRWYSAKKRGRIATITRLLDRDGSAVGVANTHFDYRSRNARIKSAATLGDWLRSAEGPWVVLGDLNATAVEPSVASLLGTGFRDALDHLPPRGPESATTHKFRGHAEGSRIDHILVSSGLEVVESAIVRTTPRGRLPSDHWPVMARLRRVTP